MPDILLFGPQGAGKGTQAELISARYGWPSFSPGAYYRAQAAAGTELGKLADSYISKGNIVPTAVAEKVMGARLAEPDAAHGLVYDGYPRIREQADLLDRLLTAAGRSVTLAIELKISDATALERLAGRLSCRNAACGANWHLKFLPPKNQGICDRCGGALARRSDDEPEYIRRRLDIYHRETEPLIPIYRDRGILREVDGERPVQEVFRSVADLLDRLG